MLNLQTFNHFTRYINHCQMRIYLLFIRVLKALAIQQNLEGLLPDPNARPTERIDIGGGSRKRDV